jgi:hypothetical protein
MSQCFNVLCVVHATLDGVRIFSVYVESLEHREVVRNISRDCGSYFIIHKGIIRARRKESKIEKEEENYLVCEFELALSKRQMK